MNVFVRLKGSVLSKQPFLDLRGLAESVHPGLQLFTLFPKMPARKAWNDKAGGSESSPAWGRGVQISAS